MKLGITWRQPLGLPECPYLTRWVLNLGLFSIRVHHWVASDDARNFHDHPWWFLTLVLKGSYTDVSKLGREYLRIGNFRFRPANHAHTVEVSPEGAWTLLLTGPEIRRWGFIVGGKWVKANKYFFTYGHHQCQK